MNGELLIKIIYTNGKNDLEQTPVQIALLIIYDILRKDRALNYHHTA
jgi:hypothetical protein